MAAAHLDDVHDIYAIEALKARTVHAVSPLWVEDKPENDTLNYFIGVAHLANKNVTEAIPFLERSIEAEDDFVFLDDAYFYLGLAYLKEDNIELAKKHLGLSNTDKGKKIILELTD